MELPTGYLPVVAASRKPFASAAALNLFIAAAGAGLLSYPFAAQQQGLAVNAACTLAAASLTVLSDFILIHSAWALGSRGAMAEGTLEEVARAGCGPAWGPVTSYSLVMGNVGALIGFLIIVGDCTVALLAGLTNSGWASRSVTVPVLALCVALPLSRVKAISSLAGSSLFAAVTVLAVGGLVLQRGAASLSHPGSITSWTDAPPLEPSDAGASSAPLVLARSQLLANMLGLPIVIFSLGNHVQVIPIFWELAGLGAVAIVDKGKEQGVEPDSADSDDHDFGHADQVGCMVVRAPSSSSASSMLPAVYTVVTACVLLYSSTGAAGYATFRDATKGDVLANFPGGESLASAAQGLLAIHILLAYPVLLFPARLSLVAIVQRTCSCTCWQGNGRVRGTGRVPLSLSSIITVALVLGTTAAAVAFPEVVVVFGIVGATVATYQIYCLPAALLWAWADAVERVQRRTANGLGASREGDQGNAPDRDEGSYPLLHGIMGGIDGAVGRDEGRRRREAVWDECAAAILPAYANKDVSHDQPILLPHVLATSPAAARVVAASLMALFVGVGVLGTGSYVYSTWMQKR